MSTRVGPDDRFTAVVLAGGASRRMGRDKRLLPWTPDANGRPRTVIRAVVDTLAKLTPNLVIVANDAPDVGSATIVPDAYPGAGSLGGIATGVAAAPTEPVFVCGADMPFLVPELISALVDDLGEADAIVPRIEGRPEPLHAVYRRSFVTAAEQRIAAGDLKIARAFEPLHVEYRDEVWIQRFDPELQSFRNLNTPEDYQRGRLSP